MANVYDECDAVPQDICYPNKPIDRKRVNDNLKRSIEAHKNRMLRARMKRCGIVNDLNNNDTTKSRSYNPRKYMTDVKEVSEPKNYNKVQTTGIRHENGYYKLNEKPGIESINKIIKNTKQEVQKAPENLESLDKAVNLPNENNAKLVDGSLNTQTSLKPVNSSNQQSVSTEVLEDMIIKVFIKLIEEKVDNANVKELLKEKLKSIQKSDKNKINGMETCDKVTTKSDEITNILQTCIASSVKNCTNEDPNRNVNVEINLNIPNVDSLLEPVNSTRSNKANDAVNIEPVFEEPPVENNEEEGSNKAFSFFNIFKFNFCKRKEDKQQDTKCVKESNQLCYNTNQRMMTSATFVRRNFTTGFRPRKLTTKRSGMNKPTFDCRTKVIPNEVVPMPNSFNRNTIPVQTIKYCENNQSWNQFIYPPTNTIQYVNHHPILLHPNYVPSHENVVKTPLMPRSNTGRSRNSAVVENVQKQDDTIYKAKKITGFYRINTAPNWKFDNVSISTTPTVKYYVKSHLINSRSLIDTLNRMGQTNTVQ